ncbi:MULTISPECIES: dihydroneopterin aldolase [Vitreoscilla]|uniref:dihydroneopterin aldolase n=1 Tax=Vitreoscilla stercoraria TaxID=61 RepID=A0ABY4E6W4_VITST|nr:MULTISPECIES: dihydroneopterin aldolase [Vitreoscilla]UOO91516.1 dihydroneopterin aldolase [Vitreoscilla stercoraria]
MDIIFLNGMGVETLVGVFEWERQKKQKLMLDVTVGMASNENRQDDLGNTISYADIAHLVRDDLQGQQFQLLETVAEHTAQLILAQTGVLEVTVKVVKPGILSGIKEVGIQITRQK